MLPDMFKRNFLLNLSVPSKVRRPVGLHASVPIFLDLTNSSITLPMSGHSEKVLLTQGLVFLARKFLSAMYLFLST